MHIFNFVEVDDDAVVFGVHHLAAGAAAGHFVHHAEKVLEPVLVVGAELQA